MRIVTRCLSSTGEHAPKLKDFSKERKMTALELQHLKRKGTYVITKLVPLTMDIRQKDCNDYCLRLSYGKQLPILYLQLG